MPLSLQQYFRAMADRSILVSQLFAISRPSAMTGGGSHVS